MFQTSGSNEVPVSVTSAVGFSINGNKLVIQADDRGGPGTVTLNGNTVTVGNGIELDAEVNIVQTSPTEYVLTASTDFYINIDMKKSYINVYVNAKSSVCSTAEALLGACNKNPKDDYVTSSGVMLTEGSQSYPLASTSIEEVFVPSWRWDDNVFTNVIPDYNNEGGDTCLHITASPIESYELNFFTKHELTIELIFYLEQISGDCATLWSYKNLNDEIFSALVCDMYIAFATFKPSEERSVVSTMPVNLDTWYQLSIVWTSSDHTLYFYLIEDTLSSNNAFIAASNVIDVFTPGGKFMLGMTQDLLIYGFYGYVDDFKIWKTAGTLNEIVGRAFDYTIFDDQTDLSYLWHFNEGSGYTTEDVSDYKVPMNWQSGGWANIRWTVCTYEMDYPTGSDIKDKLIDDPPITHQQKCEEVVNSIPGITTLGDAAWYKYYEECLVTIAVTDDDTQVDDVVTPISDTIEPNRSSPSYPSKDLCNQYTDTSNWFGINCNIYCVAGAGTYDPTDDGCYCNDGYYGDSCQYQCPYARDMPCGGGICDTVTGECTCSSEKFDPANGCETCASGWIGVDCSSVAAVIPTSLPEKTAMCFAQGHCNMFDGQAFNMKTPGQYLLFSKTSEDVSVYVRMRPCAGCKACIQQVWFEMAADDFTVKVPLMENNELIMEHNGADVRILSLSTYTINSDASVTWTDKVTLQFVKGSITVDISYLEDSSYLSVSVKTSCSSSDITGLLGNCNNNQDDDFKDTNGNNVQYGLISNDIIDNQFTAYFTKDTSVTNKFIYSYPDLSFDEPESMVQGYSVFFNGSGALSGRVPEESFYLNQEFNVSVEVKVKLIESQSGLIAGYYKAGSQNEFSLFMQSGELNIYLYGNVYRTNHTLSVNQWYHIIVAFDIINTVFDISVYKDSAIDFSTQFSGTSFEFPAEGNFLLGIWEMDPPLVFGDFIGLIGELRTWNIFLDYQKVYQLVSDPYLSGVNGLVMHYQFPEGLGAFTYDSNKGIGMTFSSAGNRAWVISDKQSATIDTIPCKVQSDVTRITQCETIFATQSVTNACNSLGADFSTFYIDACKNDDSYVPALVAYIEECETILQPSTNPIDDLCDDHKSDHYDSFCGHFCMQGTPTANGCECYVGYWDWNCAQECPDRTGPNNLPCFTNGACDVDTGVCICKPGYDPAINCQNCSSLYTGNDCDELVVALPLPLGNITGNGTSGAQYNLTACGGSCTLGGGSTGGTSGNGTTGGGTSGSGNGTMTGGGTSGNGTSSGNGTTTGGSGGSTGSGGGSGSGGGGSGAGVGISTGPDIATCQLMGSLKVKTFTDQTYPIAVANEWYLFVSPNNDIPEVKIQTVKCLTSICLKSMQVSYLTETIVIDGTKQLRKEQVTVNSGYNRAALEYFNITEPSDNTYRVTSISGMIPKYLNIHVTIDDEGYMSLLMKTACTYCSDFSVCKPEPNYISTYYDPTDPVTYSYWTVPEANQTLDDTVIEPNTTAYYSLSFGSTGSSGSSTSSGSSSGGTSSGGSGTGGSSSGGTTSSNSTSGGTSGGTTAGSGGTLSYVDPIVCTGDTYTKISTPILNDVFDPTEQTTIKLSLNPDANSTGGVFQHVGESTFTVFLDNNRVKIHADKEIIDTGIDCPPGQWSDIVLTTEPVTEKMTMALTTPSIGTSGTPSSSSTTETTSFIVPNDCFADNGRVVIGKPVGSFDPTLGIACDGSFSGSLDDVVVFVGTDDDPVLDYSFNNGDGTLVTDNTGNGYNLTIHDPFGLGSTGFNISTKPADELPVDTSTGFSDLSAYDHALQVCESHFNSTEIVSRCSSLGSATTQLYMDTCMDKIARTGNDSSALEVLQSYTTLCYYQLIEDNTDISTQTPDQDPIRYICHADPLKAGFVGSNCDIPCIHPVSIDVQTCICAEGFWGDRCNQQCPGGSDTPCSNHGTCDAVTGECACSINRMGNDCSVCADGYYGAECLVAVQNPVSSTSTFTGSFTSNSYVKTLDGAYVQMNNKDQPFTLYDDGTVSVEAQKGPTDIYPSAIKAVAVSVGGQNLTIHPQNGGTVKLNGEKVTVGTVDLPSGYQVTMSSADNVLVTGPDNFEMKVPIASDGIGVTFTVDKAGCKDATGVFGKCSTGDASNCAQGDNLCVIDEVGIAIASKEYNITKDDINSYFNDLSKDYDDTIFAGSGETEVTAGTALTLTNGGYVSLPTFDDKMISENNTETSIETRVKFNTKTDGTVFSIANDNATFGVVIKNEKYVVQYGNEEYPTNIPVTLDKWSNIGVSVDSDTGDVLFHEIHEDGYTVYKQINMNDTISDFGPPIQPGSTTLIGKWQNMTQTNPSIAPESSDPPQFAVDRFLVYDKFNDINDYEDHFVSNIDNATFATISSPLSSPISSNTTSGNSTGGSSQPSSGGTSSGTGTSSGSSANNTSNILSQDSSLDTAIDKPIMGVNFDEGGGGKSTDFINDKDCLIGFTGDYVWIPSDPPITSDGVLDQHGTDIVPSDVDPIVKEKCDDLKDAISSQCPGLDQTMTNMYMSCLNDATLSGSTDNTLDSALTASSQCQQDLGLTDKPSDSFCQDFGDRDYPVVGGTNCDIKCYFGDFMGSDYECVCHEGYWGEQCDKECPGGHDLPCNFHGTCDLITGECKCEDNWNGDATCSSCTQYYFGGDCDVFQADPTMIYTTTLSTTIGPFTTPAATTAGSGGNTANPPTTPSGGANTTNPVTTAVGSVNPVTTAGGGGGSTGSSGVNNSSSSGGGVGGSSSTSSTMSATMSTLPPGVAMVCSHKGKKGKITQFNKLGKKLNKPIDKAVMYEMQNLRVMVSNAL